MNCSGSRLPLRCEARSGLAGRVSGLCDPARHVHVTVAPPADIAVVVVVAVEGCSGCGSHLRRGDWGGWNRWRAVTVTLHRRSCVSIG